MRIGRRHLLRRHDAQHQPSGRNGALSRNARGWATAAAHYSDAMGCQQSACSSGQLVGG